MVEPVREAPSAMRRLSGFEPAWEAVAPSRLAGGGHTMVCPYAGGTHAVHDVATISGRPAGFEPAWEAPRCDAPTLGG